MSKRIFVLCFLLTAILAPAVHAQKRKVLPDKRIVGVWILQSKQYEGEQKIVCGKKYSSFKYYGPTGEYACAEIAKNGNEYVILPHEYGTYTYNNGAYTEMGRKGNWYMPDNTTGSGYFHNRHDVWKKVTIPEKLRKEIVARCKANAKASPEIQRMIRQYILNGSK